MMKKFEVERLMRAFGRKTQEHYVDAYLEFVKDYSAGEVRRAVSFAIERSEKCPNPADLRKLASIGNEAYEDKPNCEQCEDKGYWINGKDYEFDLKGFRVIGQNLPVRCKCGQPPPLLDKRWVPQTEIKHWSIARLLAHQLAERAVDSKMIDSVGHWRDFWWVKEHLKTWVELGQSIDNLRVLVRMSELIEGADPDDCAEQPEKLCRRLLPMAKMLKGESGRLKVFQGVQV